MSGNAILGYNNRIGEFTLTAGVSVSGLGPENVQTRNLWEVWRTGVNSLALSWIGGVRQAGAAPVRLFAALNGSWGVGASARLTLKKSGASVYDSGWTGAVPELTPFDDRDFERENFWDGRPTQQEYALFPHNIILVLPSLISCDEFLLEIDDTAGAAGGFDLSRIFIGDGMQPYYNMDWGGSIRHEALAYVAAARSGQRQVEEYTPPRACTVAFNHLTPTEAGWLLDIQRIARAQGEVLWVPAPDDGARIFREGFAGTLSELPAIARVHFGNDSAEFSIREWM